MLIENLQNLIHRLGEDAHEMPERPSRDDMIPWRTRIDMLDHALLFILNERVAYANAIGAIKKRLGIPVYAPEREEDVIRNVLAGNEGPLSDEAVRRLFERIIDETRSVERHRYQNSDQA